METNTETNKTSAEVAKKGISIIAGKSYLISKDIVPTLERKIGIPLTDAVRRQVQAFEEAFLTDFWQYAPTGVNQVASDALVTSQQLERQCQLRNLPVVSLDRVYLTDADAYLEVTRITDPVTGKITISSRPGQPSLDRQLDQLSQYRKIILTDVGAFGGETMLETCTLIEQRGIKIEEILLGYSSIEANANINNKRKMTALDLFEFYEWIELRDFFGIDGRRVADGSGFIPYWEKPVEWASIPKPYEEAVKSLCQAYNSKLLTLLEENGCPTERIGQPLSLEVNRK